MPQSHRERALSPPSEEVGYVRGAVGAEDRMIISRDLLVEEGDPAYLAQYFSYRPEDEVWSSLCAACGWRLARAVPSLDGV